MRKPSLITLTAFSAAALFAACGSDETGKYQTGPDDPALKVTQKDLDQVNEVLNKQAEADKAAGLRTAKASAAPRDKTSQNIAPAGGYGDKPGVASADGTITIRSLKGKLPQGWTSVPPASSMRLAEINIPAAGGGEGGVVSVTYFGPDAGGIDANVARWIKQFSQPGGGDSKEAAKVETFDAGGMKTTFVDLTGTMGASNMPGAPAAPERPDWRLLGAIVESAEGPFFFKATGPNAVMTAQRDAMLGFIKSLRQGGADVPSKGVPVAPITIPATEPQPAAPKPAAAPMAAAPAPAPASAAAAGGKVAIRELEAPLPDGWKSVPPASSMRAAEFQLAAEAGDPEPGTIAVFYFGPDAGGIQPNIDRWIGQFTKADGTSAKGTEKIDHYKAGAMEVILLDLTGTMGASQMPGAPASPEKGSWRLLGGIVVSSEGPYFFKGTGPEKTMGAHRERMVKFLTSLAPKGSASVSAAPASPAMPAAAQPAAASAGAVPPAAGSEITIQSIAATLPPGWQSAPPSSAMRLAEIKIPPSAGDAEGGLISVFYFGPQAGTIEMNLDRWYAQFSRADGKNPRDAAIRESLKTVTGLEITLVDVSGVMSPSNMPGVPATPERPNWRLLGAIINSPEGPYFFKGTGPEKTMGDHKDAMIEFLKSAHVK